MPRKNDDQRSYNSLDNNLHKDQKLRLAIGEQDLPYLPLFNDSLRDNSRASESSN